MTAPLVHDITEQTDTDELLARVAIALRHTHGHEHEHEHEEEEEVNGP